MANNKDFKVKNGVKPTAYHEAVGTVVSGSEGYYLAGASYDSVSFSVTAQDTTPLDVLFKPDGTKMYVLGFTNDTVFQYSLSTPWDVSTASYDSKSFSVTSQVSAPYGIYIGSNGTKLYATGTSGSTVYQYTLSTAWDISTASYDSVTASVAATSYDVHFSADGTIMYALGSTDIVYQYPLSTAWDISTAGSSTGSFNFNSQDTAPYAIDFNSDGTKMFMSGDTGTSVYQYSLSTAWDVSTASYDSVSFNVGSQEGNPIGFIFGDSGTKMYITGNANAGDNIYQYSTVQTTNTLDLSTGSVFEITPTSDIQVSLSNPADSGTVSGATLLLDGVVASSYDLANAVYDGVSFSVSAQDPSPYGLFLKPDGTKMYILGASTNTVYEYNLSTAWDISTSSYIQSFSVSAQELGVKDVFFKSDGTRMYIIGSSGDEVNQYDLSTAWSISTASYAGLFSVSAQDTVPNSLAFKADGTKMYVLGDTGDDVNEYTLSTAWNVTTASYVTNFSVAAQQTSCKGLFFKPDGTGFFIVGQNVLEGVYEYALSTAWSISTASYVQAFDTSGQDSAPESLHFSSDGTKMYVAGSTNDKVYQYSTASAPTITYDTAITWPSGTAPTSPAIGETDVITFTTRDGGTTYNAALAIDGAQ